MSHYKQQRRNTNIKVATALSPELQQSYNSLLNELHDYTLTQAFMDNATSLQVNKTSNSHISSFSSITQSNQSVQSSIHPVLNLSADPVLEPLLTSKTKTNTKQKIEPLEKDQGQDLLVPSQKDTLFWCFYIIKHGLHAYTTIGNKHFLIEQQEKIAAIEFLRTKKELLKAQKIKPFTSIESDLSPGNTINIKTFFALAICYDLPVIYIYKNTYIDNLISDIGSGSSPHIIQWSKPNEYAFVHDVSIWPDLCNTKYKWAAIDKPVGAASLYKTPDILELFNKLQISTNNANTVFHLAKKLTKKEMYDAVIAYFM
jgi:hypothetical protein